MQAPAASREKWAEARRFYEDDLASGFVRLQAELSAASLSNPGLREKFLPRLLAWKQLVLGAVREAVAAWEADGTRSCRRPFTAEVIASWIAEFWLGMETADLLGRQGRAGTSTARRSMPFSNCWKRSTPRSPRRSSARPSHVERSGR